MDQTIKFAYTLSKFLLIPKSKQRKIMHLDLLRERTYKTNKKSCKAKGRYEEF